NGPVREVLARKLLAARSARGPDAPHVERTPCLDIEGDAVAAVHQRQDHHATGLPLTPLIRRIGPRHARARASDLLTDLRHAVARLANDDGWRRRGDILNVRCRLTWSRSSMKPAGAAIAAVARADLLALDVIDRAIDCRVRNI